MNDYKFEPMPLSDDEVVDRFTAIKAAITELATQRYALEIELHQKQEKRLKHVAARFAGKEIGDGRDLLTVAPATTASINSLMSRILELERRQSALLKECFYLQTWYPVTLRKAGQS